MHVKTASLATGTVIFVIGELKFGSAAVVMKTTIHVYEPRAAMMIMHK